MLLAGVGLVVGVGSWVLLGVGVGVVVGGSCWLE